MVFYGISWDFTGFLVGFNSYWIYGIYGSLGHFDGILMGFLMGFVLVPQFLSELSVLPPFMVHQTGQW